MRFRLCGDMDCPDWILAEINTMSRLSSVKMKLLTQQVAKSLIGEAIDYDKAKKLTSDAKFELSDVKASIAALSYLLTSASRHGVDEEALNSELQQLGMPKEHATSMCKVHGEHSAAIADKLKQKSLRLSRLEDVQWRVDLVAGSSHDPDRSESGPELRPEVQVKLQVSDPATAARSFHHLCLSPSQLQLLVSELQKASAIMDAV